MKQEFQGFLDADGSRSRRENGDICGTAEKSSVSAEWGNAGTLASFAWKRRQDMGTPRGARIKPPKWLKEGDTVTLEIDTIGQPTNPMTNES